MSKDTTEAVVEYATLSDVETDGLLIAQLAVAGKTPVKIEADTLYAVPSQDGGVEVLDTSGRALAVPVRKKAKRIVRDARSFISYLAKHARTYETEVWADATTSKVVGVIDSHQEGGEPAGWEGHTINLELVHTENWKAWLEHNGKPLNQLSFANHLEANASDVRVPDPATFLEIAQSIQSTTNVDFKSSERLSDGQIQLKYEETSQAKAGVKGDLDIPAEFELVIRPYIGSPLYKLTARFRYKIRDGVLTLTYVLDRPEVVLENAFADVVDFIRNGYPAVEEKTDSNGTVLADAVPAFPGILPEIPVYFGRPQ